MLIVLTGLFLELIIVIAKECTRSVESLSRMKMHCTTVCYKLMHGVKQVTENIFMTYKQHHFF